jgi:hypothetical protein
MIVVYRQQLDFAMSPQCRLFLPTDGTHPILVGKKSIVLIRGDPELVAKLDLSVVVGILLPMPTHIGDMAWLASPRQTVFGIFVFGE